MSDIFLIQSKRGFFEHGNLTYYVQQREKECHTIYKGCNE